MNERIKCLVLTKEGDALEAQKDEIPPIEFGGLLGILYAGCIVIALLVNKYKNRKSMKKELEYLMRRMSFKDKFAAYPSDFLRNILEYKHDEEKALRMGLYASIYKWARISDGYDYGDIDRQCGLCYASGGPEMDCLGCPVRETTGKILCIGTPFKDVIDAIYSAPSVKNEEIKTHAKREHEFLMGFADQYGGFDRLLEDLE